MASSKVMSSTSPANPDLPRHSSTTLTATATTTSNSSASNPLLPPPPHSAASSSAAAAADSSRHLHHHHHPYHHRQPIFSQPHQNLLHHQHHHPAVVSPFGSMNMEDVFKNIYSEPADALAGAESSVEGSGKNVNKMVDEVWKEIVTGGSAGAAAGTATEEPRMTLKDFLTKAGAVSEEEVRGVPAPSPVFGVEQPMMNAAAGFQFPAVPVPVVHMQNGPGGFGMEAQLGFGNGMVPAPAAAAAGTIRGGGSGGGSGRGKRRAPPVEEVALDKVTQQKQRRMIKNRESAARSRERKQAYTVELESLVMQLEEENARLLRDESEQKKERLKQLMENLIPVAEKRKPPRVLRRVRSMSW